MNDTVLFRFVNIANEQASCPGVYDGHVPPFCLLLLNIPVVTVSFTLTVSDAPWFTVIVALC